MPVVTFRFVVMRIPSDERICLSFVRFQSSPVFTNHLHMYMVPVASTHIYKGPPSGDASASDDALNYSASVATAV